MSLKSKIMLNIAIPFVTLVTLLLISTFYGVNQLFSSSNIFKDSEVVFDPKNIQNNLSESSGYTQGEAVKLDSNANYFWKLFSIIVAFFVLIELILIYRALNNFLSPLKELEDRLSSLDINNLQPVNLRNKRKSKEIKSLERSFDNLILNLKKSFSKQGQFVNNAAHEIRTPLSIIKTSLQLIEYSDKTTAQDYEDTFFIIKNSSVKLEKLMESLLFLAMNNQIQQKCLLSINELVTDSFTELKLTYPSIKINLEFKKEFFIYADKEMFINVIDNILRNSAKYGSDMINVNIDISDTLNIIISDNGVGIPKEKLPFVKEAFYKCEEARSSSEGFGLGLAIVDEIMNQHGGKVLIESNQGVGTTVTLCFIK